jgi:hypothetical protein
MDDGGITHPAKNPGAWTNSPLAHRNARGDEHAFHMTPDYGRCPLEAEGKIDCESVLDVSRAGRFILVSLVSPARFPKHAKRAGVSSGQPSTQLHAVDRVCLQLMPMLLLRNTTLVDRARLQWTWRQLQRPAACEPDDDNRPLAVDMAATSPATSELLGGNSSRFRNWLPRTRRTL